MKRSPRTRKISVNFSESISRQLNMYALAAGAAGVGVLALAQPAEAKIVYTQAHHVIGLNGVYKLDLTHDGTVDFVLRETQSGSMGFKVNQLVVKPKMPGNAVGGYSFRSRGHAAALKSGAPINRHQGFVAARSGEFMASVVQSDTVFYKYYGQWYNVTNRYLGLKFKIHGKTHYGWARLNVAFQGFKIKATLTGYAYETIVNKGITAGKTMGTT